MSTISVSNLFPLSARDGVHDFCYSPSDSGAIPCYPLSAELVRASHLASRNRRVSYQIAAEADASFRNRADCSAGIESGIGKGAAFRDPSNEIWTGAPWKKNTRDIS
jgi:hypothetical protein